MFRSRPISDDCPYDAYITRCRDPVNDLVQHNVLYVRLSGDAYWNRKMRAQSRELPFTEVEYFLDVPPTLPLS